MRKRINVILASILAVTLLIECAIGEASLTAVYSTDTILDTITYLGEVLYSEDYVESVTKSSDVKKAFIALNESKDSNLLAQGSEGLEKMGYDDVSYEALTNLVFNLEFMGIKTCEKEFGVSFSGSSIGEIVNNYLTGEDKGLQESASSVATSLKCPNYQATITGFDTSTAVYESGEISYYGPFTFTDNTLSFAEVTANEGVSVYKKLDDFAYETVKYVNGREDYYVGVQKGISKVDLSFEGVFFTPDLVFFEDGIACYGSLLNKVTTFSLIIGNEIMSDSKTQKVLIPLVETSVEAGATETVIIYDEDENVETVILGNTEDSLSVPLEDGEYVIEHVYNDGFDKTETQEISVVEGEVSVLSEPLTEGLLTLYMFDTQENKHVSGKAYVYDSDNNFVREVLFSETSRASFYLPYGEYSLLVVDIADGYAIPEKLDFEIKEESHTQCIQVAKGNASAFVVVTDEAGNPVEGASVTLDADSTKTFVTDEGGIAKLNNLSIGNHKCLITNVPKGYVMPSEPITFTILTGEDCITEKIILSKIKFELKVSKSVEGSTTEIKDAVYKVKQQEAPYFTKILSVEEFPLELEVGTYAITEIIPGDGYNLSEPSTQTIEVNEECVENVKFTTPYQTGTLTLRNYSTRGYNEVLSGIGYTLYDLEENVVAEAESDANGNVVFENLPLGSYTLQQTVVPEGYEAYKKLVSVKLEKAGEVVSYDAILAPNVGSIMVYHDSITQGIPYYLYDSNGKLLNILYTDADGVAVFKNLPIGIYEIKTIDNSEENNSVLKAFNPIIVHAYSGTVELTKDNLNVAVGYGNTTNVTTTSLGVSKIILSSEVTDYDKSLAGVKDLGAVNVDNISTVLSEKVPAVDYSGDVTQVSIDNVIETVGEDEEETTVIGSEYVSATGVITLSKENNALGDGDFILSETQIEGSLNQTVKLPKTGASNLHLYVNALAMFALMGLAANNFQQLTRKRIKTF